MTIPRRDPATDINRIGPTIDDLVGNFVPAQVKPFGLCSHPNGGRRRSLADLRRQFPIAA